MLLTLLPVNVRHAGQSQVAVGPDVSRPLVCDTAKVNTGSAETTYTDRDIDAVRQEVTAMRGRAADPLAPHPIRDRAAAREARLQEIIDRHEATRAGGPAAGDDGGAQ
jgi:hypothetical protein